MHNIVLNGHTLSITDMVKVAREKAKVELSTEAMAHVISSRELIYQWISTDVPVYGLNRGVGLNKDKTINTSAFEPFNRNLVLSHTVGVAPELDEDSVRAVMLARLNTLLLGRTGVHPAIVDMYAQFLNEGIHPVVPSRGSVGVADIGCLSHVGLAMIGEGEVDYNGVRMPAAKAIKLAGLQPVTLGPKDGLSIVSSNALAAGLGALLISDVSQLVDMADMVYALSLEGLQGNVSPLDESVLRTRPFPGQMVSANAVKQYLAGSYLWQPNLTESIQDPLSFRAAFSVHGSVRDALHYVQTFIELQLNSSDDNPCVLAEEGRILSSANFEVTTWALGFEMLGLALSHLSKLSSYRTIKLATPAFTGLSRFLSPDEERYIGFGVVQKTVSTLDTEIRHLSNPATADYLSLSGEVEDHASNASYIVQKTARIVDNLYYILGIEAMHAAQAIDLKQEQRLGKGTRVVYEAIRQKIPYLDADRTLSHDIHLAYNLFKSGTVPLAVKDTVRQRSLNTRQVNVEEWRSEIAKFE